VVVVLALVALVSLLRTRRAAAGQATPEQAETEPLAA
jgi:hypothetical protein